MKWIKGTINDLCKFNPENISRNYPFDYIRYLDISSVGSGVINLTEETLLSDAPSRAKRIVKEKDTIISTVRPGNKSFYFFKSAYENFIVSTGFAVLRPNESKVDPKFLYYLVSEPRFTAYLVAYEQGANYPAVTPDIIGGKNIEIPILPIQNKIASILSAYDDLIENNLRRIKLLEEKAQLYYKELLTELSNSKTKREEYVKDCLDFYIGGGWGEENYEEKFTEPGYVIRGTDIPDVRSGNISGVPLRYHKVSNLASRKMQTGDIAFEISNGQINNIGRTVLISNKLLGQFDQEVMCASFAKLIRVNKNVTPEFFYLYLNESQENGLLYQYKSNSANGINNFAFETFIDEVKITLPSEKKLILFSKIIKPIFSLISTLGEQNTKLREARDILLPRLMSGEIEV